MLRSGFSVNRTLSGSVILTLAYKLACFSSFLILIGCCSAQQLVQVPREDGALTPLRVYSRNTDPCPPLALISPGAGGNENGYRYLAEGLEADGWRAVVMGHKESGAAALRSDIRDAHGIKGGLRKLVDDPKAYDARLMDISAALQWAERSCKTPYVALIGHSMGARTVMIEAGAKNKIGVKGQDRFKAYVAMSPDGPDPVFPENAWNGIHKPMLILTGTRDKSMQTGDYKSRTIPYGSLPAGCKWLGVIEGATHMNFAGIGFAGTPEKLSLLEIKAFLDGLRTGKCGSPVQSEGIMVQSE
jgi:predicted dienelactone hydrolase